MQNIENIVMQSRAATNFLGNDFTIFRMAGDASSREYFRILYPTKQTCTMMLLPQEASSLAEEYESKTIQMQELPFLDVHRLLQSKNVRVPEIYAVDLPSRIILLEDLGDTPLIEKLSDTPESYLMAALELLACVVNPHPETDMSSIAFSRAFDQDLYMWEFEHYLEYGIEKIIEYKDTDVAKIRELFFEITQTYLSWSTHLTHRDYHSKNIHVIDHDQLALIDFQDALQGPIYYDLVSLLKDAYTTFDRSLQEKLVTSYQSLLDPSLEDALISQDEFLFRFDLMSLHRNLKAAGRFVYIDQVKNNPNYLKDVPQALQYAIETLNLHSQLKGLKNTLQPYLQKLIEEV
ncbi:MAG: phosphotransferase [Bdellovibrionota bacterium]|nr:phosphotransferase [Deltaproteobacteria bacterium]